VASAEHVISTPRAQYVGYTDIYENLMFDPSRPPYLRLSVSPNMNTGRQFFVKMSYLIRF
jgi:hypothetical protein